MKRVVSFSLWGNNLKYLVGAIRNAELCNHIYPGWIARFYIGSCVPKKVKLSLLSAGAEVIEKGISGDWKGMFWRFEAASDPNVEIMISRDCDSRLNCREASAVKEWVESPYQFHIMRDHPAHSIKILGGMWGVKAPLLRDMTQLINSFAQGNYWQVDQHFLRKVIYPKVKSIALTHDEFFCGRPFPQPRQKLEFVGQVFDENEMTPTEHQLTLANSLQVGVLGKAYMKLRLLKN